MAKLKQIKRTIYPNAELFKFENARVQIVSLPTEEYGVNYGIEFKILSNDLAPRAFHKTEKDKIVSTLLKISKESALSLMVGFQERLKKDGVI